MINMFLDVSKIIFADLIVSGDKLHNEVANSLSVDKLARPDCVGRRRRCQFDVIAQGLAS